MGWDGVPTFMRYDIYAFDIQSMTVKRITTLDGTGEYDPSWSPNGKKIVHDVVYWDGTQSIYITDVKTGASAPLAGAENGNDAVWSPSGKWIVFDHRWVGEPNIYIVPATGGSPQLLRSDAVRADWAPNSKRLVFQQPSDGSIRTIAADGGKGGETFITPNGSEPVWSPDGNWIAYVSNGNIWKVQVNILGKVVGIPFQVTNLSGWGVGGPTWSLDSQTIIFNGGVGDDFDIWKVPAVGGEPIWLTGASAYGDYGPENAKNTSSIAYASISPDGQAARLWVAAYTYDIPAGALTDGTYPYHFEFEWSAPEPGTWTGQGGESAISSEAPVYDGYVLLRGARELRGVDTQDGLACEEVDAIHPAQATRFLIGWVTDFPMTYDEALAHFESITARVVWGDGMSADHTRHEVIPFSSDVWFQYACTFTR